MQAFGLQFSPKNRSRALLLLTLVLTATPAAGQLTWGDWQYSLNGNNAVITRYTGTGSDVSIPSTINGHPVAFINVGAFSGNTSLTNVFVPSSVAGVLNGAAAVPFSACRNLVSITVDPLNSAFSSAGGVFFNKNQTSLLEYPLGRPGSYAIPVGVRRVASYAFYGCTNLAGVRIPNTVTNIMSYAFYECYALRAVTIPASVQSIGYSAFSGCDYLTNVFFGGNAPLADALAFARSWVLLPKTMYYIPGTTGWGPTYAGFPTAPLTLTVSAPTVQGGQFSFSVSGPSGISVVVESCTSLDIATWSAIQIRDLSAGFLSVSDRDWTNYPARFYRVGLE